MELIGAAYKGSLEIVKYAHENGCPWDTETPIYAVENGHINIVKYCFNEWSSQQDFLSISNFEKIIGQIDLDDPVWRKLFSLDLSKYPSLKDRVEKKQEELRKIKDALLSVLIDILPSDIIKYCIYHMF